MNDAPYRRTDGTFDTDPETSEYGPQKKPVRRATGGHLSYRSDWGDFES